jgi:hypothetical protein
MASDLSEAQDLKSQADLVAAPDLTGPFHPPDLLGAPDLSSSSDLRSPADMTAARDLSVAPDLKTPPDLSTPPDLTTPPDLRVPPDLTPPPPDFMPVCNAPADCPRGDYCCATITLGAGTVPNCPLVSENVACSSSCNSNIAFSCNVTDTARLCNSNADCTEGQYPDCCQISNGMTSHYLCVSSLIKLVLGPPCK